MATVSIAGHGESVSMLVPFQIAGNGGVAKVFGEHAVLRQQLIGTLMTNWGERIMFPKFGANIQAQIFDPIEELVAASTANDIAESLRSISSLLTIGKVQFVQDPSDPAGVLLIVQYSVNNNSALLKVKIVNGIITDEDPVS